MKIELYTFGRAWVYMHGTGAAYVTLIASFVFKASARWSLFIYLSRRIVGN